MPTNSQAIADLEASKQTFENECNAASGADLLKLLTCIQHIANEVGALAVLTLNAGYIPQTTSFQQSTSDATAFVATLNSLKATFAAVAAFAGAVDTVIKYVK